MTQPPPTAQEPILDVFQPGLRRGAERLPFDPAKAYFYVEHPTEGWRVYLRSACFIHRLPGEDTTGTVDPTEFLVVRRTGAKPGERAWEMPKGQMEGKDGLRKQRSILQLLKQNARREVEEESHLQRIHGLQHTGLCYQNRETSYPPGHFFQYHIFTAYVDEASLKKAQDEFAWFREHPAAFARQKRDRREKDAVEWYRPSQMKLSSRWSPGIIARYIASRVGHRNIQQ